MAENTMDKTLVMKLLEGKGIPYEAIAFPDEIRDAEEIAVALALPPGQVFKTLVVTRPLGKPMLVMIPADQHLDLKKLAKAVSEKKLRMATHRQAEELTGLQVGGISALALVNRGFDIRLDRAARQFDEIYVSAGARGLDVRLAVDDLIKVTGARIVEAT